MDANKKGRKRWNWVVWIICIAAAVQGCSANRTQVTADASNLLYKSNDYLLVKYGSVGVFSSSASLRSGIGSARSLYEELLKEAGRGCFQGVFLGGTRADLSMREIFDIARGEKYDFVIVSDVLSAVEGSDISASSVLQQIQVFQVNQADETLVLATKVEERGEPAYSRDFIFFKTRPVASASIGSLIGSIGYQFASLVCARPDPQTGSADRAEEERFARVDDPVSEQ